MNNPKYIISVDPGLSGAAIIWEDTKIVDGIQWTRESDACEFVDRIRAPESIAVIEDVTQSMTSEIKSAVKLSTNYGFWRGLMTGFDVPVVAVAAPKWTRPFKKIGESLTYAQRKRRWRIKAKELYPKCPYANEYTADAILIGHWFIHCETAQLPLT